MLKHAKRMSRNKLIPSRGNLCNFLINERRGATPVPVATKIIGTSGSFGRCKTLPTGPACQHISGNAQIHVNYDAWLHAI